MSRGAYILEIRRFLILYTVSLHIVVGCREGEEPQKKNNFLIITEVLALGP